MELSREEEDPTKMGSDSRKRPSTMEKIHRYFREYCNSTSIHGMKYLAEDRSLGERLLWLGLICCSLSACIYLILQIYGKFQRSPVIVTFATSESPIYTIPFPAVTVCPLTQARKEVFDFSETIRKMKRNESVTDKEYRYAKYMSLACEKDNKLFKNETTFTEDFFRAIDELKIPFDEVMISCKMMNIPAPCEKLFHPIILDHTVCYTFNMLDRDDIFHNNVVHYGNYHNFEEEISGWSNDKGYFKQDNVLQNYPIRAFLAGADNALEITFYQNYSNNDHLCIEDTQGYHVSLHAPYAIPLIKKQYFNVPFERVVMVSVRPKVISTSEKVRQFDPDIRQCYFSTEKPLKYFKVYSPKNCKLECLTNYTLNTCGCVGYYMPRENATAICGNSNYKCMEDAELQLKVKQLMEQIVGGKENFFCDCKPLCTDVTYETAISPTYWDFTRQFEAWNIHDDVIIDKHAHFAKLIIYFEQDSFLTSERSELYGPTDFLANFGGLLGLFTGFSLLSAVEIIYFLSVRMCCNFRLHRIWTGVEN
ncbi:unnamed protein product [Phyllotreta striolata]|uniref:Uncharacterized protein n=1 Tax=Phyllotreta striolata TaxID=444603 RepID=A0A9N9XME5_PHYSR|nr:unnamed protein product [Phyllotreta striolata]